jgi:calcineurin-like phosphoesterase family protein
MSIFITSDHHFGDDRVMKYRYRPYTSVLEMNESMVEIWNSVVSPEDVVYHLGDVAVTAEALNEYVPRLNGRKRLVCGNYEHTLPREDLERLFEEVHDDPICIILPDGDLGSLMVKLMHYPLQRSDDRDVNWNLCGHIHDLWKVSIRMMNVSVDAWHFRPVNEGAVFQAVKAQREGYWDANVYPDADLDWQEGVSWRERPWWEPTKTILAEKRREAEEAARERARREWTR